MIDLKNNKLLKIFILLAALFLFCTYWSKAEFLLVALFSAITPLIIGAAIAYIINLPLKLFERLWKKSGKKIDILRRPVCIVLSFLTVALLIFIIVSTIVPELHSCIMLLIREVPPFVTGIYEWAKAELNLSPDVAAQLENILKGINWENAVNQAIQFITNGMGSAITAVVSFLMSVVSVVFTLFVSVVFAVYLLSSKEKLAEQFKTLARSYTKQKFYGSVFKVTKKLDSSFSKFIVGQCTEAVILGVLMFIGMLILRLPYTSMISVLIGFTALIPIAGAYIGGAVGTFMIFTVSPVKALIFLVFLILLQQFEGNVIYPRVVGKSIGLPGIWVLAAITIGGGVLGIVGMLIAVPIASTLYAIIKEDVIKKNKLKQKDEN